MDAFITGSYAYGTPGPSSDVDLVVYVGSIDDRDIIMANFGNRANPNMLPIMAGNLNIIMCDDKVAWSIWKYGTELLKMQCQKRNVRFDKKEAAALFDSLRVPVDIDPIAAGSASSGGSM